jgi:hypothetical protein
MGTTTNIVREQGVVVEECDVPAHMTLSEYRAQRARTPRRRRRPRLRRRASR